MRILLAILLAFSLIGGPAVAVAAVPQTACTMSADEMGGSEHHGKMDCCTPECATPAAPALLPPDAPAGSGLTFARSGLWATDVMGLPSLPPLGIDHPPRIS